MRSLRALLWPLSLLYGAAMRLRAWGYRKGVLRQRRLKGIVISIGNLTVGGTGKTPMVLWLARRLAGESKNAGILIRGYRGSRGRSDEASLLESRLGNSAKIGVGVARYLSGRALSLKGIDWFVLDDGFQHLRLARDANIVLLDATDPFGGGHLLPVGRLREPKSALARADLIIITRSGHAPAVEAVVRRHTAAPIFYAQTQLDGIFAVENGRPGNAPTDVRQKKFFAFCGIGNPVSFFQDLRGWQMQLVGSAAFRDHYRYSQKEAEILERRALAAGADALVCTEKDVFNLSAAKFSRLPVVYCRISLQMADDVAIWQALMDTIERNRTKAAR